LIGLRYDHALDGTEIKSWYEDRGLSKLFVAETYAWMLDMCLDAWMLDMCLVVRTWHINVERTEINKLYRPSTEIEASRRVFLVIVYAVATVSPTLSITVLSSVRLERIVL
jgi:hypothetical protein